MDNFNFFDAISIASFILQLQNSEGRQIDSFREEMEQKFDEQTRVLLGEINKKLDLIVELLTREKGDLYELFK